MFNVSSNPHVRARMTTAKIMQLVVIALLPAALMGIYNHGLKALAVLVVSTGSAALAEWLYDHFMHKKNTVKDFSAVVTGLLIGLNMPAGIPLWIPVLGSIFAIIVVKQLFGGLGQNFMNPALAARCFLMISFAGKMTDFSVSDSFKGAVDGVTGATPLAALRDHGFVAGSSVPVKNLIFGNIQGTIGETSVIAILIGAAMVYGNRLRYKPHYTKGAVCIWRLSWCSYRNFPYFRSFRRGRFLCDYFLQPAGTSD